MEALGGFSYAFNATMQIVTRKTSVKKSYKVKVLSDVLIKEFGKGENFHSYSITGGEPLIHYEFIKELAENLKKSSKLRCRT